METKFHGHAIKDLKASQIKITADLFKPESTLHDFDSVAIQMRADCLFKFNKVFKKATELVRFEERNEKGTLANRHFQCRDLALSSIVNALIDEQLGNVYEGGTPEVTVNRRKAMVYADEGKIDHEGKNSIYGQIVSQLKAKGYNDLSNFRHRYLDSRIYRINFRGEGSIDAGGPYRDSITNIVQEME